MPDYHVTLSPAMHVASTISEQETWYDPQDSELDVPVLMLAFLARNSEFDLTGIPNQQALHQGIESNVRQKLQSAGFGNWSVEWKDSTPLGDVWQTGKSLFTTRVAMDGSHRIARRLDFYPVPIGQVWAIWATRVDYKVF